MKRSGFSKPTPEKIKEAMEQKRQKAIEKAKTRKVSSSTRKTPQKGKTSPTAPRKRKTARQIRRQKGQWATSTADNYFSKWIRERDGECLRCHRTDNLTCSHYHKRAISITRFCPLNCISLCGECHADWEGPKEGYTDFMIQRLGTEGYIELKRKSGRFMKRSDAVAECKALIKD